MPREDRLKAYLDAQWQYQAAIGNVDEEILREYTTRLHELWMGLDDGEKRVAFHHMLHMIGS